MEKKIKVKVKEDNKLTGGNPNRMLKKEEIIEVTEHDAERLVRLKLVTKI